MASRRAVFLDRDGTLNVSDLRDGIPCPPASLADFQLYPDVAAGCCALHRAGYALVVATNQPDVGRGTTARSTVEAMHARLTFLIPEITRIEVCYDPGRSTPPSAFRKPAPGMLLSAARDLDLDLGASWMIGDRWRDIDCGFNAGVRTIFIDRHYGDSLRQSPNHVVQSFSEAVGIILAQESS